MMVMDEDGNDSWHGKNMNQPHEKKRSQGIPNKENARGCRGM